MIEIITDSTCDIPDEIAARCPLTVLPYLVVWGGHSYRDRIDLTPAEFYQRLRSDPRLPTTALAGPALFQDAYQAARERGASAVVVITVASNLSGASAIARQAAVNAGIPVHFHESGGTTMGMGWQILAAARAILAGAGLADVLAEAERVRQRVRLLACLDTLEYAYRGGRLSRLSWVVGSALHIKGLIAIDHKNGSVRVTGRVHGRRRAIDQLYERFFDGLGPGLRQHVAVLHGDAEAEGRELLERVRTEQNPAELLFNTTGPIIGAHTGPGALALAGYAD